jgi:hypothetical protein
MNSCVKFTGGLGVELPFVTNVTAGNSRAEHGAAGALLMTKDVEELGVEPAMELKALRMPVLS